MLYICSIILKQIKMNKQKFTFLSILVFYLVIVSNSIYSQNLSGTIKSDLPIPFASISVKGQSIGTASNADGFFEINDIKEGSYEFVFSAIGFKKLKKNISIQTGKNTIDVILEPSSYDIEQVVVTGTMKETFLSAFSSKGGCCYSKIP